MSEQTYVLTIDQWEEDEQGDYAIAALYRDGRQVVMDVFSPDGMDPTTSWVTYALDATQGKVTVRPRPFNPYGDGITYDVTVQA